MYSLSQPVPARRVAETRLANEGGPPPFTALESLLYEWLELSGVASAALGRDDEEGLLRALEGRDELMGRIQAVFLAHTSADATNSGALVELGAAVQAADARLLERMRESQDRLAEALDQMESAEPTPALGYDAASGHASASTFEFVR